MSIKTQSEARARANVRVRVWDLVDVERIEPRWDELSNAAKMRVLSYIQADHESRSSNTTCIGLHEYWAENLDGTRSVDDKASEIALGDQDTEPAFENTELNDEVGRTSIDEFATDGTELIINAFLPREQLNQDDTGGNPELTELGLVTEGDRLLNHSLFNSFEKTPQRAAQFEVRLDSEPKDEV